MKLQAMLGYVIFFSLSWFQINHEIIHNLAERLSAPCSAIPGSTLGPATWEKDWPIVSQVPVFVTCFAVWWVLSPVLNRVAWLQWMKPEWQIAWLQSPKILAFTEAIARKYVHLRAQAEGKKESLASCGLCSASLRPLCLFQRLLPSRDLTKQI